MDVLVKVLIGIFGKIALVILAIVLVWAVFYFRSKPIQLIIYMLKDIKKVNKEHYPYYGFTMYSGLVGSGKTISMVEYAIRMKNKYKKLYIVSNFECSCADLITTDWKALVLAQNPNGLEYGVLILLDEVQLTLSSDNWSKAPDNLLELLSMNRKSYRHILGTSQVFERVNIKIREQSNIVVECSTLFKRWTFQKAFNTIDYSINGDKKDQGQKKRRRLWRYNFIQSDEIRQSYDTYQLMNAMEYQKNSITLEEMIMSVVGNRNREINNG